MKRLRTIFIGSIAVITALMTTSCEKQYITEEYVTEKHYNEYYGSKVYTREYTIVKEDWKSAEYADGRKYLYAEFDNPDVTENVMETGAVLGYFWFTYDAKTNSSSWNLLPYVYPYLYENDQKETAVVGENIRLEYETGRVSFIVEDLDGILPDEMGDELYFKVVVIDSLD
ncbi:MAG: hypothetical protein IKP99_05650 [Bacteroidales bacterium]|nr:hypothetical protein [Bacteroidales bacterium]MBR6265626.1 hypothetical protein [Bacteroidales bacterium]